MYYNDDSLLGSLLGLGLLCGSFWGGRKTGYYQATKEYEEREYKRDIEILKMQIQQLKAEKEKPTSS